MQHLFTFLECLTCDLSLSSVKVMLKNIQGIKNDYNMLIRNIFEKLKANIRRNAKAFRGSVHERVIKKPGLKCVMVLNAVTHLNFQRNYFCISCLTSGGAAVFLSFYSF